jgi:hypothetical protein
VALWARLHLEAICEYVEISLQPLGVIGLCEINIGPCLISSLHVIAAAEGCQIDHGSPLISSSLANTPNELPPIHFGHHDVADDEIGLNTIDLHQSIEPMLGGDNLHWPQRDLDDLSQVGSVLDNENAVLGNGGLI